VARDGEVELLYAARTTRLATDGLFTGEPALRLALETWQAGGNYLFAGGRRAPAPLHAPGSGSRALLPEPAPSRTKTRFSASFAAGVKVSLARHLRVPPSRRGASSPVLESDRQTLLRSREGCLVHASGSDISQSMSEPGLALRF